MFLASTPKAEEIKAKVLAASAPPLKSTDTASLTPPGVLSFKLSIIPDADLKISDSCLSREAGRRFAGILFIVER